MNNVGRRLVTLPLLVIVTLVLTVALPLLLLVSLLLAMLLPGARAAPRVLLFLTVFLWCETLGVIACGWLWLTDGHSRDPARRERFLERNFVLQFWWAGCLKEAAARLFRLRFIVEDDAILTGDGVIMLPRHCSIGDTLIPIVFYCARQGRRLRYVLKRELLFDPCLDIVGNRLPNYFVDRRSQDTASEVAGIQQLTTDLPPDHGILIYPEGTRFSHTKRLAVQRRLEERDPELAARTESWDRVLPPRTAGPVGLLTRNPGRDVVFCAHTGFEGSASFRTLFNGSWLDTTVRIRFWRIAYADLPSGAEALREFLLEQWERMNREVARLQDSANA